MASTPSNFENYTASDARGVIKKLDAVAQAARKYISGDHWQLGKAYIGPKNIVNRSLGVTASMGQAEIQRGQVTQNAIKEILERHIAAVLGREPQWSLAVSRFLKKDEKPKRQEQAAIDEALAALLDWWDKRQGLIEFAQAGEHLLATGEGYFRMFLPPGLLKENPATGQLELKRTAKTLADAMGCIYFHATEPEQAGIAIDRSTMDEIGVYISKVKDAAGKEVTHVELYYVDRDSDDGLTVFRILSEDAALAPVRKEDGSLQANRRDILEEGKQDLASRIPLIRMKRAPLITQQVEQLQNYLNLGHTMGARNTVAAGFRERVALNAQAPKEIVKDPETGKQKLVPMELPAGGSAVTHLTGVATKDKDGNIVIKDPQMIIKDPSGVENFVENKRMAYTAILEECHQLHALISGDATASGESRLQARADFASSVRVTKTQMDAAGRALFEAVLAWAASLCGQEARFAGLRVNFDCRLDTGPLSSEEQAQIRSNAEGGFISYSTARTMLGIEDPDAEESTIAAEEEARAARKARLAAIEGGQSGTLPKTDPIPPTGGGDDLTDPQANPALPAEVAA